MSYANRLSTKGAISKVRNHQVDKGLEREPKGIMKFALMNCKRLSDRSLITGRGVGGYKTGWRGGM